MNNLLSLIIYIFKVYPNINELSKPRLIKMIYLIDWKYTIDNGSQYSDIRWYYDNTGPYSDDIIKIIQSANLFSIQSSVNKFGSISEKIRLTNRNIEVDISNEIKFAADFIIQNTYHLNWSNFIDLVFSTFPLLSNSQFTELNLSRDFIRFNDYNKK